MSNLLGERDGLRVVFDDRRGYARLETLPSQAEIDRLYAGSFWAAKGDEQAVRREQAAWWDLHYGDWLELARPHLPGTFPTLLDIGSGFGYFLRAAHRHGFGLVVGCDPNPDAFAEARQVLGEAEARTTDIVRDREREWVVAGEFFTRFGRFALVNGKANDLVLAQTAFDADSPTFDLVSALWVMEHLADPEQFLTSVRGYLKPGGVFVVAVPSDFNALQLQVVDDGLSARPYWWIDPTHLNYWTPATFANFLGRHGFRVAAQTTMYPMERFILDGEQDYPADSTLGPTLHTAVRAEDAEMEREERIDHYQHLALGGQGREIVMICIKE